MKKRQVKKNLKKKLQNEWKFIHGDKVHFKDGTQFPLEVSWPEGKFDLQVNKNFRDSITIKQDHIHIAFKPVHLC
jgi:hypothetical protein